MGSSLPNGTICTEYFEPIVVSKFAVTIFPDWLIDLIAVEVDLTPKSIGAGWGKSTFVQLATKTIRLKAIIVFFHFRSFYILLILFVWYSN